MVHYDIPGQSEATCHQRHGYSPRGQAVAMLTLELSDFLIELEDGAIKNVGASNKTGTAKLFDVETASARTFGDKRVKLVFDDAQGSGVQVALFPADVRDLVDDIEQIRNDSEVFE